MSSVNPTSTSLTPAELANIPSDLNVTTPEQRQVYASALEFEKFFVQQMLKPMENAGQLLGGGGDDSSGSDSASGTDSSMSGYKDMAQDQMTQAVLDGGGLGIAATLYQQMAEAAGVASSAPSKGAQAPGGASA